MSLPKVLVVTGYFEYPLRSSVKDLIYSFQNSGNCKAYMYSIEQGPMPEYLKKVDFDIVVFTTVLLGERWGGKEKMLEKVYPNIEYLRKINAVKVVHPQDEWIHTTVLNDFINDFEVQYVFTVAPESEWKKIYDRVDHTKVKFSRVLTGYLEDKTLSRIIKAIDLKANRSIDIGYRAYKSPPWLGKKGYLKTTIADVFKKEAPKEDFVIDISTEEKDTIFGDDWFKFIASCKYFIGVEGGSTVIDKDGLIFKEATLFEKEHPNAEFEDYEQRFFKGRDGELDLVAISPRHLETAVVKTCQVLIEGDYNGVLKPNIHYIELKKDFSNLNDVFSKMKDNELRIKIAETAYNDVVLSGKYSYKAYVDHIIKNSLVNKKNKGIQLSDLFFLQYNRMSDKRFWNRKRKMTLSN